MSALPATPRTALTALILPTTPKTHMLSVATSASSICCSPTTSRNTCSPDSGISDTNKNNMQLQILIQQCQRIMVALNRDEDTYRLLRERLAKISQNNSQNVRKEIDAEQQICNVCSLDFESLAKDDKMSSYVSCCTCKKLVCRTDKCAIWLLQLALWECHLCHSSKESLAQTSSWVAEQISFNQHKVVYPLRARSEIYIPIGDCNEGSTQFDSTSEIGLATEPRAIISAEQKVKIREYVEEIVSQMLGDSLDIRSARPMSKGENHLPGMVNNYNANTPQPNSRRNHQDFADVSESRLRKMIESIVAETLSLSTLSTLAAVHSEDALSGLGTPTSTTSTTRRYRTEQFFEPKLYHDLLATAVLNKIVDKQNKPHNYSDTRPALINGYNVDSNGHLEQQSLSSNSSIEPISEYNDMRAQHSLKHRAGVSLTPCGSERNLYTSQLLTAGRESALSDYLASHLVPLPDLSATATESEEDDYISGTSSNIGAEGSWGDNWLLKRKRASSSAVKPSNSMGMLVPAPKEDIRAQIGDRTADEVSDLSEFGSDTDDSVTLAQPTMFLDPPSIEIPETASLISNAVPVKTESEYIAAINIHTDVRTAKAEAFNSHLNIQNVLLQAADEEDLLDNERVPAPLPLSDQLGFNHINVKSSTNLGNSSSLSINCNDDDFPNINKDDDNELFAPNPKNIRTHKITQNNESLIDSKLTNGNSEKAILSQCDYDVVYNNTNNEANEDDKELDLRSFLPGSIAEREHKKWYNAVEMPNNPYAPDALKRRISGSQERFMDLPNISTSIEPIPIGLVNNDNVDKEYEADYKRYSRDYYINETLPIINNGTKVAANTAGTPLDNDDESGSEEIVINEAKQEMFLALPAHVVEESLLSESNTENSINASTSGESDTQMIYDFNKQETKIVRIPENTSKTLKPPTPTRCTTPANFRFLQPKRKLMEPNEVLSSDQMYNERPEVQLVQPAEKPPVIEEEIIQALPSVRALAQAFLAASNNSNSINNNHYPRPLVQWSSANEQHFLTDVHSNQNNNNNNINLVQIADSTERTEEASIDFNFDAIRTQPIVPSTYKSPTPILTLTAAAESGKISPVLGAGFLRSNITFFENLKFN